MEGRLSRLVEPDLSSTDFPMRLLPVAGALALATALLAPLAPSTDAAAPLAPEAVPAAPLELTVDGGHSSVVFRIQHMGAAWFYGRFNEVSGEIVYDEATPAKSSVSITIPAMSVDTNSEKRDQHVTSPDFLDAKQFPELSFESKTVEKAGDLMKVTGELSMRGVKQDVSFDIEKTGEGKARGGAKVVGFHTTFTVDRTDFGMTYGSGGPLGDEVELMISLECRGR